MNKYFAVLLAGIGGILPTLAKLAAYYSTDPKAPLPELNTYIAMGLFFVIGIIVCIAMQEFTPRQALIAGISGPAIIAGFVNGNGQATLANNAPVPSSIQIPARSSWISNSNVEHASNNGDAKISLANSQQASLSGNVVTIKSTQDTGILPVILAIGTTSNFQRDQETTFATIGQNSSNSTIDQVITNNTEGLVLSYSSSNRTVSSNILTGPFPNKTKVCANVDLVPSDELSWIFGSSRRGDVRSIILTREPVSTDPCALNDLIKQFDGPSAEGRKKAVQSALDSYRDSPEAAERAIILLQTDQFRNLSGNGRINTLVFLSSLSAQAWSLASKSQLIKSLKTLRLAAVNLQIGPQTLEKMLQLENKIQEISL